MFAPISSTGIITLSTGINSESTSDLVLQAGELSRPMFVNITTATETSPTIARNDTAYQGAVYDVTINETVTIWYKLVNGDNETLPTLYGYNGYGWNDSLALEGVEFITDLNDTLQSVVISRGPRKGQADERSPVDGHFWGWNPVMDLQKVI